MKIVEKNYEEKVREFNKLMKEVLKLIFKRQIYFSFNFIVKKKNQNIQF